MFFLRNVNDLPMKMESFKKFFSKKNCNKTLEFANFENGGIDIQRDILRVM